MTDEVSCEISFGNIRGMKFPKMYSVILIGLSAILFLKVVIGIVCEYDGHKRERKYFTANIFFMTKNSQVVSTMSEHWIFLFGTLL